MSILGNNLLAQYYAQNSLSAKSYVQDGLIALWDGIENIGWGKHDNNTTTWKNLVGNVDFKMIFNNWGWDVNCFLFNNSSAIATGRLMENVKTLECCFEQEIINSKLVVLNCDKNEGLNKLKCCIIYNQNSQDGLGYYFDGDANPSKIILAGGETKTLSATWANENENMTSGYYNGILSLNTSTHSSTWGDNRLCIGGLSHLSNYIYGGVGKIYCLRLYNRLLSNSEILQNYNIDKARFNF